jgi:outer membrane protein OmpA-like peptidoglycan-associated protein/tetratricopeptide (TPR) repeat protein
MRPSRIILLLLITLLRCIPVMQAQGYDPARVGKKAAGLYAQGIKKAEDGDFKGAIVLMDQSIAADRNFVDAYLSRAGLYGELKNYEQSVADYERSFSLDAAYTREYKLPYAINLAGKGDFEKALAAIEDFKGLPSLNESSRKAADYRYNCFRFASETGKKLSGTGYVFTPRNMGENINTEVSEYYPALTIDGNTLIYTRRIKGVDEDFFVSERSDGIWGPSKSLSGNVNTNLNEGAQTISQDGQLLVFTGCNFPEGFGSCDLYYSILTKQGWSLPKNIGSRINTESWESAPCLSPDKRDLYFASSMPGGLGGIDIYVSRRQQNGQWGKPENLGPSINTAGNESCPFIHADNQTLYFTSNGHQGYGGDDLFISRKQKDGNWSAPENLGYPINTIENEGSLVIAADGKTAYYASDRQDSRGGLDLYTFEMRKEVRPLRTLWVEGKVYDVKTKEGLPSAVELIDLSSGNLVSRVQTDEEGRYLLALPLGADYGFHVNRKGYLFHSGNFNFSASSPDSVYRTDIPLQPLVTDANIVLKNIFFGSNSFALQPESASELDLIVKMMNENPSLKIRIDGHTDNTGKAADNLTLSNNRARSVVSYLTSKGIAPGRLQFKGFGSTQPVADNTTETGKSLNRRTELRVTGN